MPKNDRAFGDHRACAAPRAFGDGSSRRPGLPTGLQPQRIGAAIPAGAGGLRPREYAVPRSSCNDPPTWSPRPRDPRSPGTFAAGPGRDAEAEEAFREAIRLDPGRPESHDHLAAIYFQSRRPDQAIREWREAVRVSLTYAPGHYNLGSAYQAAGRLDEAPRSTTRPSGRKAT